MTIVFWLPAICALLHITEEFVWPGGFSDWFRSYRPENALSFTPRFALRINALLIAVTVELGWMGPESSIGVSLWLTLAALLAGNALFHIVGTIRTRRYSPGTVTGAILYLPLCIWGFAHFLSNGEATPQLALVSFAIGASYNVWSFLVHRLRAASMAVQS